MDRLAYSPVRAAAVWLLVAAVCLVSVTNGVCLCARSKAAAEEYKTCIVSLDVCGAGHAAEQAQGFEAAAICGCCTGSYIAVLSFIPPAPADAVASADAGDTEKPPEA